MPLQRRLPKFGFTNLKRVEFKAINLSTLEEPNSFIRVATICSLYCVLSVGKYAII